MGGSVYLQKKSGATSGVDSVLAALKHIMEHYQNYFRAQVLEIWENAPSTALGGTARFEIPVNDLDSTQKQIHDYIDVTESVFIDRSVFRIIGYWEVNDVKQRGYFSLNFQPEWRTIYGDISITLYPTSEIRDLVFLFWKSSNIRSELTDAFIEKIGQLNKGKKLFNKIYFAKGEPSPSDARSFMATYYTQTQQVYDDLLLTIESESDSSQMISKNLYPYKRNIILESLAKIHTANDRLDTIMKRSEIEIDRKHSISLIAAKDDSFAKAVDLVSSSVIIPAFNKLYGLSMLKELMEKGIKEHYFPLQ
jgi:hypothetical protein